MKKVIILILLLIFCQNLYGETPIMKIDEVKPGMIGIGKTVFKGTEIEEFNVEIVSILKNHVGPGKDMILAKASGGPLEVSGLIGGMSGSPIYIDGKLIGACAYGWPFMKETMMGITPIEDMLNIFERAEEMEEWGANSEPEGPFFIEQKDGEIRLTEEYKNENSALFFDNTELVPVETPLVFSGVSFENFKKIKPIFQDFGFLPMQGGGFSKELEEKEAELAPGGAVSAVLVSGDMSISAVGTLTYIDGDQLLAFGHPMLHGGSANIPMAGGYIHSVMPSQYRSYKMGSPTKIVGSITQDRTPGVMGRVGEFAEMIPMKVNVSSSTGREESFDYEIFNSRDMTPLFSLICIMESMISYESQRGDYTIGLDATISIEDYPDIKINDFLSRRGNVTSDVAFRIGQTLYSLIANPFQPVKINNIEVNINYILNEVKTASIKAIRLNKTTFRPGETVKSGVIVKPFDKESFIENYEYKIPEDFPDGKLIFLAASVMDAMQVDRERAPAKYNPQNLEQLIEIINQTGNNSDIEIQVLHLSIGATVKGQEFPALPHSVLTVMLNDNEMGMDGINFASVVMKDKIFTNYNIQGFGYLSITIDRNAK